MVPEDLYLFETRIFLEIDNPFHMRRTRRVHLS
jgi:hypothetical protein